VEDPRTEAARAHFDRWSATYEQDRASRRLREIQTTALAMLALMPDDELLDIAWVNSTGRRNAQR